MINKKFVTLSLSAIIIQPLLMPFALAQTENSGGMKTDSEAWPWMDSSTAAMSKTSGSANADSVPALIDSGSRETRATAKAGSSLPKESPASAATASFEHREIPKMATPEKSGRTEFRTEQAASAKPKTTMLFGRIDQLTASAGAQFPTLKAQTAKVDPRGVTLKATASDSVFSGEIVRSFPTTFEGQYGGKLQLSMVQTSPLYAQVRAAEAGQASKLLRQGLEGSVNVTLRQSGSDVTLEPLQIYCSVPMSESRMGGGDNIPGLGNIASMGAMGQMMKSMMSSMPYMFVISLGNISGTGVGGQGVQGSVVKQTIHQLSPTVIEQDIIATERNSDPTTGRTTGTGYSESVVRVTKYDATRLFIQAASVDYNNDKRFLRKMLFQGYLTKGQVEQVTPMGGGDLQKMLPPGFNLNPGGNGSGGVNPFQGLFGQ